MLGHVFLSKQKKARQDPQAAISQVAKRYGKHAKTKIRILDTQKEVSRNIIPKRKNLARLWALRGDDAKHGGVSDVCKRIFGFGFME